MNFVCMRQRDISGVSFAACPELTRMKINNEDNEVH